MGLFDSLFPGSSLFGGSDNSNNSGLNAILGGLFPGDPPAPTAGESTAGILQALTQYYPQLFDVIRGQIAPTEQSILDSEKNISPQQAQLNVDITKQYAPQLADVENQINNERKLSDARGDLGVVQGPGGDLAKAATNLASTVIDPEFFKLRGAIGDKYTSLVNGLDPNALSGGERAEVERSVNAANTQTGNVGNNSAGQTAANAMQFGSALNSKRAQIGNILSQATNAAPSLRSGIDPYGKPTTQTPYTNSFQSVTPNTGTATQFGTNAFNQVTGLQQQSNQINADRRDSLDRVTQLVGAL